MRRRLGMALTSNAGRVKALVTGLVWASLTVPMWWSVIGGLSQRPWPTLLLVPLALVVTGALWVLVRLVYAHIVEAPLAALAAWLLKEEGRRASRTRRRR